MNKSTLAVLSLLSISFVWGIEFVLVHDAIALIEPHTFNTVRFALAAIVIFAGLFFLKRSTLQNLNRDIISKGFILGLLLFAGFATQTIGLLYTSVSNTGFITGLCVVFVPILAFFILKEKLGIVASTGIGLAIAGLYLLTMAGGYTPNKGDYLVLMCAVSFALHVVYTGKFLQYHSALLLTLIQMVVVTLLSALSALLFENWQLVLDPALIGDSAVIIALLIGSVIGTAAAYIVQTVSQKFITATRVEMIFTSEPVFAAGAAWIMLGEKLGVTALVGAFFILSGMLMVEMSDSIMAVVRKVVPLKIGN